MILNISSMQCYSSVCVCYCEIQLELTMTLVLKYLPSTKSKCKSPLGGFLPVLDIFIEHCLTLTCISYKATEKFYRGCNLTVLFLIFWQFYSSPLSVSTQHQLHLKLVLPFSRLDTPHLQTTPGPLVECCIAWGLWRKGIPGHSESTQIHTHTRTHYIC